MDARQIEFRDRIARIAAGDGCTKFTIFVGQDLAFSHVPVARTGGVGLAQTARNAGFALTYPMCMLLGFLSHGLERYAEWVFMGLPKVPTDPDLAMVKIALTSVCFTFVVTFLCGLRDRGLIVPKLLGVAAGMLFFHNLVHLYPGFFAWAFAPMWVAKVTSMTQEASLVFRGVSYPF